MRFARDILLVDIQTTGNNPEKDFALQIAAVLLDKDNLLEKDNYSSYIKHPFSQTTNDQIVQTLGIPKEQWMRSPGLKEVVQKFNLKFPLNVTLASQNVTNILFLKDLYLQARLPYEFDYHILELWTLAYVFFARQNLKKIPTAETLATYFKIPRGNDHNAFDNCRLHADLLRKLMNQNINY